MSMADVNHLSIRSSGQSIRMKVDKVMKCWFTVATCSSNESNTNFISHEYVTRVIL